MLDHHLPQPKTTLPPALSTLSEVCIGSARQSLILCSDEWTKGSLPVYGYAFAQYIFTSSLVLVISTLLPCRIAKDREYIETASEMLRCLVASGCFVAQDLSIHLQRVRDCLERFSSLPLRGDTRSNQHTPPIHLDAPESSSLYPRFHPLSGSDSTFNPSIPTTPSMVLDQPEMEDILGQSVLDIDLLQPLEFPGDENFNSYISLPLWDNGDI